MISSPDARHFADSLIAAAISTGADAHIDEDAKELWTAGTLLRQRDGMFVLGLMLGLEALLNSPDAMCEMLQQLTAGIAPDAAREIGYDAASLPGLFHDPVWDELSK